MADQRVRLAEALTALAGDEKDRAAKKDLTDAAAALRDALEVGAADETPRFLEVGDTGPGKMGRRGGYHSCTCTALPKDERYDRFRTSREGCLYHQQAAEFPSDHSIPWNCPTYWDGCNCKKTIQDLRDSHLTTKQVRDLLGSDEAVEVMAMHRWEQIKAPGNTNWPEFGDGTAFNWHLLRDEARVMLAALSTQLFPDSERGQDVPMTLHPAEGTGGLDG